MPCSGNDVVDIGSAPVRGRFEDDDARLAEWLDRHLTDRERLALGEPSRAEAERRFWRIFAAKEAAYKALGQAGIDTPYLGYALLDADLDAGRVTHLPTGTVLPIRFTEGPPGAVHCVAAFRLEGVRWGVERLPTGEDPSAFSRRCLLASIASARGVPAAGLAATSVDGIPRVLWRGCLQDWGVSLSHSGRFVAFSFAAS